MNSAPANETDDSHRACRSLPWRSAAWGWVALAVVLAAGLPLFLRMPLWIDVTLYDLAARAVLSGGTHYRDVFDTNPPGFVWALCVVRTLLGPSTEAVRAVDFLVVSGVVVLLARWARAAGATRAGMAWTAAGAAGFYLFLSEFNHCQRDVWQMLPAVVAILYRLRRSRVAAERTGGWVFRTAVLEGMVWGLAVWVKPHVILVAAAAWAVTQGRLAAAMPQGKAARGLADLGGSLAGGLIVGLAGLAWLVATGTWEPMYDVFTRWNTSYLDTVLSEHEDRLEVQFEYFPPWSLLAAFAAPLAVLNVLDARLWLPYRANATGLVGARLPRWLYHRDADAEARYSRGVLAAVYLVWMAVAFGLQKHYHYVHVPETLLMLALFAANRWAVAVPALGLQFAQIAWLAAVPPSLNWIEQPALCRHLVWHYPDRESNRFRWWAESFASQAPPQLRNGVAFQTKSHSGADWVELAEVEAFLKSQGVRAGDDSVMCWHDTPHVLYLSMNLRPPIRFMHLSTASGMGDEPYRWVKSEVEAAARPGMFVVSDLRRVAHFFPPAAKARMSETGPGPDLLPPVVPAESRDVFPLNQPTVFRSGGGRGRYVVHRVANPVGEIHVPAGSDAR